MQSRLVVVACFWTLVLSGRVLAEIFDGYVDDNGGCPVWNDSSDLVLIDPKNHLLGLNRTTYTIRITFKDGDGKVVDSYDPGEVVFASIPQDSTLVTVSKVGGFRGVCDPADRNVTAGIPTVSEWGLVVMTVLLMTAGTISFGRLRATSPMP